MREKDCAPQEDTGEINIADLMTKHLTALVIQKHVGNMNLEFRSGRSDKAAKLHSILKGKSDHPEGRDCDFWAERGERGRWVRIHNQPRTKNFSPDEVPRGPGRKTRLRNSRVVHGMDGEGRRFTTTDDWSEHGTSGITSTPWTGKTIFLVDKIHDSHWGTDQRRQRDEVSNAQTSRASAPAPRPRWADLSDTE